MITYETGTVVVGTGLTTVISGRVINEKYKTFMLENRGAATFIAGVIEWSVNPESTSWGTADGTSLNNLGSAAVAYGYFEDTRNAWRIRAAAGAGGGTVFWQLRRQD